MTTTTPATQPTTPTIETYSNDFVVSSQSLIAKASTGIMADSHIESAFNTSMGNALAIILLADQPLTHTIKYELISPAEEITEALDKLNLHKKGVGMAAKNALVNFIKVITAKLPNAAGMQQNEVLKILVDSYVKYHSNMPSVLFGLTLEESIPSLLKACNLIGEPLLKDYNDIEGVEPLFVTIEDIALETVKASSKDGIAGVKVFTIDKNTEHYKNAMKAIKEEQAKVHSTVSQAKLDKGFSNRAKRLMKAVMADTKIDARDLGKSSKSIAKNLMIALKKEVPLLEAEILASLEAAQDKQLESLGKDKEALEAQIAKQKERDTDLKKKYEELQSLEKDLGEGKKEVAA